MHALAKHALACPHDDASLPQGVQLPAIVPAALSTLCPNLASLESVECTLPPGHVARPHHAPPAHPSLSYLAVDGDLGWEQLQDTLAALPSLSQLELDALPPLSRQGGPKERQLRLDASAPTPRPPLLSSSVTCLRLDTERGWVDAARHVGTLFPALTELQMPSITVSGPSTALCAPLLALLC